MKKVVVLMMFLLSGCVVNHGQYTVLSNKVVDVSKFDVSEVVKKEVKGVDRSHLIFVFPTKANPNINDALRDAFRKADGDVMTDVTIYQWSWWIPYIYGQIGWTVEGDVVKTRKK